VFVYPWHHDTTAVVNFDHSYYKRSSKFVPVHRTVVSPRYTQSNVTSVTIPSYTSSIITKETGPSTVQLKNDVATQPRHSTTIQSRNSSTILASGLVQSKNVAGQSDDAIISHSVTTIQTTMPDVTESTTAATIPYADAETLHHHNSKLRDKNYFGCVICKAIFLSMEELFEHAQQKHQADYLVYNPSLV